jgi:hypothetical protein
MKRRMPIVVWILWAVSGGCLLILSGCYSLRASSGDGQVSFQPPRPIQAADIAVPAGYYIEPVATGLTFPAGVAFDDMGQVYVVEAGYSYGEAWATPRLLRVAPDRPRGDGGTRPARRPLLPRLWRQYRAHLPTSLL